MTREDLSSRYFEWLCGIVFDGRYLKGRSYSKLFELLHSVDFEVVIGMDQNRAEDGIDLRYRFGDEQGYIQPMIASLIDNVPCSVLEMMVALGRFRLTMETYYLKMVLMEPRQYLSPMRLHLYLNPYLRPQCIKTSTEESISVQV